MKNTLFGLSCAVVLMLSAGAQANDGAGAGVNDCSDLVKLYDAGDADLREKLMLGMSQWALGYMTGLNVRMPQNQRRKLDQFTASSFGEDILAACYNDLNERIINVVNEMYMNAPMHRPGMS